MRKLKIGYVIKYFHPLKGGAEGNFLNLALRAVSDGHEVHVFTSSRKGGERLTPEDEYEGIKIHRCKTFFNFSLYFAFYPSLLFKLLKADLDIIHVSGFGFIWHDFVLIIKKIFSKNTKFINTPHGPFMALGDYNIFLKFIRAIYAFIQKLFLNWLYEVVIEVNTFQWQWIVKSGIDKLKIKFVPNGVDRKIIDDEISSSRKREFSEKYDLADRFVISYLGRISKYKGIQHAIKAFSQIEAKPNIAFLIMGHDEGYGRGLKAEAEKCGVKDRVRFVFDVSEEEKLTGLEASQIFIFPSKWEAFGIVLLEAMSRGNALISTRTEGGKFLIKEGENGYLYEFGDIEDLRIYLEDLYEDEELLLKIQDNNREKVLRFTWDKIYKEYYSKVLLAYVQ